MQAQFFYAKQSRKEKKTHDKWKATVERERRTVSA
jgi:hypothetical protein